MSVFWFAYQTIGNQQYACKSKCTDIDIEWSDKEKIRFRTYCIHSTPQNRRFKKHISNLNVMIIVYIGTILILINWA